MQSSHLSFGIVKINPAIPIAIRHHREEQCRQNASADASSIGKDNHHCNPRGQTTEERLTQLSTVPLRSPFPPPLCMKSPPLSTGRSVIVGRSRLEAAGTRYEAIGNFFWSIGQSIGNFTFSAVGTGTHITLRVRLHHGYLT